MSDVGGKLAGKYPAIVKSYNAQKRTCMVEIPSVTDNSEAQLEAEIEYSLGDKSANGTLTEIEILAGDKVWCEFIQGDPRNPIITGYRNPRVGNSVGTRRWHHANIELLSDGVVLIKAAQKITLQVGGSTLTVDPSTIALIASAITNQGAMTSKGNMKLQGGIEATDDIKSGGISTQNHDHTDSMGGKTSKAQ